MSEFDSLSDSDWLDIASRTSDDNDSISDHDELSSRPLSRRSSISFGSSHESEVEAWEGFVDESSDESPAVEPGMSPVQPQAVHAAESLPTDTIPDISHEFSDDQQVRDALDQSMVGTLSASRASTTGHSAHNSIRDLRLSFPDPLTSSRDQLNKSYTQVSASEVPQTLEDEGSTASLYDSIFSSHDEPEHPVIASQVQHHEVSQQDCINTNMGLDIVLYGSSSPIKWSFVQGFIQKAASFSGNVVLSSLDPDAGPVQTLNLRCGKDNSILTSITVHDFTNDSANTADVDDVIHASLAIVYLPSTTLPMLSLHTAYLPVLVPTAPDSQDSYDTTLRQAAEDDWELLAVPKNRTVKLSVDKSPILSADALSQTESWKVFEVIRNVLDTPARTTKSGFDNTHPVHAVTFLISFALVSIIVGFAFNTAFRTPVPVPTGTTKNNWGIIDPHQVNRSLSLPATGTGTAMVSSSPKDFSLTVFTPGVTSLSVTPQVNSLSRVTRVTSLSVNSHSSSLSIVHTQSTSLSTVAQSRRPAVVSDAPQASSSKDVLLREAVATSLSEVRPAPSTVPATRTRKRHQPDSTSPEAPGARIIEGLSEVLDASCKAFSNVVKGENGVQDLVDAVDELMGVIQIQTQAIVRESKGKARALGEEVVSRNDKARGRAKELKKKGEKLFNSASSQFRERTRTAKMRAKVLKETFLRNEAWKSYIQTEWVPRLMNAEQCTKDKPGWARKDAKGACRSCNTGCATRHGCPMGAL